MTQARHEHHDEMKNNREKQKTEIERKKAKSRKTRRNKMSCNLRQGMTLCHAPEKKERGKKEEGETPLLVVNRVRLITKEK